MVYLMIIHNMPGKVPSEPQQNGVLKILVCGSVLDTVRKTRWLELIISEVLIISFCLSFY